MNYIKLTINNKEYETTTDLPVDKLDDFVNMVDIIENHFFIYVNTAEFYDDYKVYLEKNVKVLEIAIDVKSKLWLAETIVTGYDTFKGAVVQALTETSALKLLSDKSFHFDNCSLEFIGNASNTTEKIILTDFNNG